MTDTNTAGATMSPARALAVFDQLALEASLFRKDRKNECADFESESASARTAVAALIEREAALAARNAELERERDALRKMWQQAEQDIKDRDAANDALAAEVKALREDAERLSWHEADMAKGDEGVGIDYDETSGKFRFPYLYNGAGGFGGGVCHSSHDTLRAAIDAARASAATGGA